MLIRLEHNGITIHETRTEDLKDPILIGRSHQCAWAVPKGDTLVSSQHVSLTRKRGSVVLVDLKSSNGTFYQGKKITKRTLRVGDHISIGDCTLVVEVGRGGKDGKVLSSVVVQTGRARGERKELAPPKFSIGSDPTNNLVFLDMLVSRHHAEIGIKEDGSCWIRDLGSKNGTSVNGVPLRDDKERLLKDGDKISVAHLEFVYQDGAVSRANSQVWLRIGILAGTLLVVTSLYWTYQRMKPSAERYIENAREAAAQEKFSDAGDYVSKAIGARKYSQHEIEAADLRRMLGVWESTVGAWRQAQRSLEKGNWVDASRNLGVLQASKKEAWSWNKKAPAEKDTAMQVKSMLDAYLRASGIVKRDDISGLELKRDLETLKTARASCPEPVPPYLDKLKEEMALTQSEIETVLKETSGLEQALDQLTQPTPPYPEIVHALDQLQKGVGGSAKRRAATVYPVALGLSKSFEVLNGAATKVREMNFREAVNADLGLPTMDACAIDGRTSEARSNIEKIYDNLKKTANQVAYMYGDIEKRIERPDAIPTTLRIWRDDQVVQQVFACDSLAGMLPKRSRTEPSGEYDRMLGIEEFYTILSALPNPVDPLMLQDLPFQSTLTKTKELVTRIERFRKFMKEADNQWLMSGPLAKTVSNLEAMLVERDGIVTAMMEAGARQTGRPAVIAVGIAVTLSAQPETLLINGRDAKTWLVTELKPKSEHLRKLSGEYNLSSPFRQIEIREEILKQGIPGDPIVRRMWSIRDSSKGR